jgi:hypothetical protein
MQVTPLAEQVIDPARQGAIRDELRRVLVSPAFRGSRRCCRFLEYSVQHVLDGNVHEELRERNIGIEVFQRPPDYDTAEDAIVRVTANEVRKRLAQFYQDPPTGCDPVISLPPGSYAAAFRWKPSPPGITVPEIPSPVAPVSRRNGWLIPGAAAVLLALAGVYLAARPTATPAPQMNPSADALWSAVFHPDQKTNIVMADAARYEIQQLLFRDIRLEEYLNPEYPVNLARSATPEMQRVIQFMGKRETTSVGSTTTSARLSDWGKRYRVNAALRFPRHLNVREFNTDNFILLGSRLSIPWVELFEPSMNYVIRIDPKSWNFYIENRFPKPGEPRNYERSASKDETWVDIAVLPSIHRSGTVLIFNAIDMLGVEAAVEAMVEGTLASHFSKGGKVRYGEVLLRVKAIGGAESRTEIVAQREPVPSNDGDRTQR